MGMWSTVRGVGAAFGFLEPTYLPIACSLGRNVYRETKRAAQIANIRRTNLISNCIVFPRVFQFSRGNHIAGLWLMHTFHPRRFPPLAT